jgi:hypothetical protein
MPRNQGTSQASSESKRTRGRNAALLRAQVRGKPRSDGKAQTLTAE